MISEKQLLRLFIKANLALAKSDRMEREIEEFLVESGGSYDMEKFGEWYRKRLYAERG